MQNIPIRTWKSAASELKKKSFRGVVLLLAPPPAGVRSSSWYTSVWFLQSGTGEKLLRRSVSTGAGCFLDGRQLVFSRSGGGGGGSSSSISAQAINCCNLFCKLELYLVGAAAFSFRFSTHCGSMHDLYSATIVSLTSGPRQICTITEIIAYCLTLFRVLLVVSVWNGRSPTSYQLGWVEIFLREILKINTGGRAENVKNEEFFSIIFSVKISMYIYAGVACSLDRGLCMREWGLVGW